MIWVRCNLELSIHDPIKGLSLFGVGGGGEFYLNISRKSRSPAMAGFAVKRIDSAYLCLVKGEWSLQLLWWRGYEAAHKILLLFKIWNNLLNFIYINTYFLRIIIIMIMSSLLWYLRVYTQLAKALLGRSLPFRLRLFIYYCTEQQTCTVGTWTWLVDYFDPLMIIVSDKILKITPLPAVMYTWKQWGTLDTTCPSNSNLTRCWSPSSHKGQHAILEKWLLTPAAD